MKLLNTVSLLEIFIDNHSSEDFEGSVSPSQPSDIKSSLY